MKGAFPGRPSRRTLCALVAAAPVCLHAAGPASPSPTPAVDQYFITWKMTARGHSKAPSDNSAQFAVEATQSSAGEGQAVVTFGFNGERLGGRILRAYVSNEEDRKWLPLSVKIVCGPISVSQHDHYSLKTLEPLSGTDSQGWMPYPPRKQADGSWLIEDIFYRDGDLLGLGQARTRFATLHLSENWVDRFHYEGGNTWLADVVTSGPIHSVCDDPRLPSDLRVELPMLFVAGGGGFSVPSTGPSPDLFFKEWKYLAMNRERDRASLPLEVDWKITVRRLGKCHVSGEIPLNDDPVNPDINDEEIDMGVEHGSDTIDPDTGVAALNIRLTCDTVPIKNAKVDVKVEVQKNTGGHTHDPAGRPRGRLTWNGQETRLTDAKPSIKVKTDDDGRAHLTFKPGKAITCGGKPTRTDSAGGCDKFGIAGIYRFTATPDPKRFPGRKAEVAVEAKVDGLSPLDGDSNYVNDVGTASHASGDNATDSTRQRLHSFASAFRDVQLEHNKALVACGAPPGPAPEDFTKPPQLQQWPIYPLWVIDVSLPFGGQYDLEATWSTPHQTHARGDGVDLSVHNRILSGQAASQNKAARVWPADGFNVPVCDGYKIAPQGWLMIKMWEVGMNYGHWDESDFNAPKQPWHLHVNQ